MSVVRGRAPTQAVVSMTVGVMGMALETLNANLGCLLSSWAEEMASGQHARSDLVGMVFVRNSRTREPWLRAQHLLGVSKILFKSVP